MVQRRIFGKEAVEDGPEQEGAAALERLLVERHSDFDATPGADAGALAHAANDGAAVDAADAPDLTLGGAVGEVAEHRQDFTQRGCVFAAAALDQAEVIHA